MKQLRHSTPHFNIDMTECKLNIVRDRDGTPHFIASFPKKWEQNDRTPNAGAKFKIFEVTEWDEVELMVKP